MVKKGSKGCDEPDEPDEPMYVRINEVMHFHGRGFSDAEIARWLYLPLMEVQAIIVNPKGYMRCHGLEVKSIQHIDRLPTPAEIHAAAKHLRRKDLAKRRAMPSKPYVTYMVLDRPVYPEHPAKRRCGY